MLVSLLSTLLLTPPLALADEVPAEAAAAAEAPVVRERKPRKYQMEIGLRGRRVSVPRGIMDLWYTDSDVPGWPLPGRERPFINGWAYGLEFVVKSNRTNGIFWFEWLDSSMPEGYWDDVEDPPNPVDGDYIVPSANLGLLTFGADYAYEVPMVRLDQTKGAFGLGFVAGGGLGLAVMVGKMDKWQQSETDVPSYVLYDQGAAPNGTKDVPRIYPMVDINVGLRFNFGDRVVIRFEGGLHTMLYYGASAGFSF
jgi:hypothetical protein